ncbi:MAG: hypothetical protein E6H06_05245 [Bacteroidetes bacterium]|nr:MAG: hypothetical protein E6H06_05245 [Bacteroidota bacterium]
MIPYRRKQFFITIFLFPFLFSFSSCLTPAKIDGWISEKYGSIPKQRNVDYANLKMQGTTSGNAISETKKDKTKVLPLVLFWRLEYSQTSTLNPSVPFSYFNSSFISYANSKGLRQKLNGQKLELSVDKLPNAFAWKSVDHIIFLVLYYIHWEQIFFQPQKQDITVTYRLLKDNEETKKGTIIIKDINQKLYLKFFQFSGKKFIGRYLDQYNTNIQTMSKELVDKLIIEL